MQQRVVRVVRVYNRNIPSGITGDIFTQKGSVVVGTGASTYVELPPGTAGQVLTPDSGEASGLKWDNLSGDVSDNYNYLVNGGFDFAQRQTPATMTTIADQKYGPDRWKMERANADLQFQRVSAIGESGLNCNFYGKFEKITNTGKMAVYQILTHQETVPLRGRTVTFQMKVKRSAGTAHPFRIAILALSAAGTADTIPAPLITAWNATNIDPTLGANISSVVLGANNAAAATWTTIS